MTQRDFTEEELAALDDPDQWDWEDGSVVYPDPSEPTGLRLIVDIDSPDVQVLAPAARAAGMSILTYVRQAALEKARAAQVCESERDPGRRNVG